jgi:hypothetical protein
MVFVKMDSAIVLVDFTEMGVNLKNVLMIVTSMVYAMKMESVYVIKIFPAQIAQKKDVRMIGINFQ